MPRFVIYQMGKVASTSVMRTLENERNVTVDQCHFLSERIIRQALERSLNVNTSDYLYNHLSRQLIRNLDVHRVFKQVMRRDDAADEPVYLVSMHRNPLAWTRSALVQDMDEYLPILRLVAEGAGGGSEGLENDVRLGLRHVFDALKRIVDSGIAIDRIPDVRRDEIRPIVGAKSPRQFIGTLRLIELFSRPHRWFYTEFEHFLDVKLEDFEQINEGVRFLARGRLRIYILPYETIGAAYAQMISHSGLPFRPHLRHDNRSDRKQFGDIVQDEFSAGGVDNEILERSRTAYMYMFYRDLLW